MDRAQSDMRLTGTAGGGPSTGLWRATLSGFCAILVGLGFARFAYSPLIPALIGALADRAGFRRTLRYGLVVQAPGVGLIAAVADVWALALSSLLTGAFLPGIVTLVPQGNRI